MDKVKRNIFHGYPFAIAHHYVTLKAALSSFPDVIIFYLFGNELYLGKFV